MITAIVLVIGKVDSRKTASMKLLKPRTDAVAVAVAVAVITAVVVQQVVADNNRNGKLATKEKLNTAKTINLQ